MSRKRSPDKNLQNVSGGISYERLLQFSVMTEDENGNDVEVKNVSDIKPNNHYWLNPHTNEAGSWMVLGYGHNGVAERFIRGLKGEASLTLKDVAAISEAYPYLV